MLAELDNFLIMDDKKIPQCGDDCCLKGDEIDTRQHQKIAEFTKPGSSNFRKRIGEITSGNDNGAEWPKYQLNNGVGSQDVRNEIIFSFQHLPKVIMNEVPGNNDTQIND